MAGDATEQVRKWVAGATVFGTARGGAALWLGEDDVVIGALDGSAAWPDPAATPANTDPVPSSMKTTPSAENSQARG